MEDLGCVKFACSKLREHTFFVVGAFAEGKKEKGERKDSNLGQDGFKS